MFLGSPLRVHESPRGADCHYCIQDATENCEACLEPICAKHSVTCAICACPRWCMRCVERGKAPLALIDGKLYCEDCLAGAAVIAVEIAVAKARDPEQFRERWGNKGWLGS